MKQEFSGLPPAHLRNRPVAQRFCPELRRSRGLRDRRLQYIEDPNRAATKYAEGKATTIASSPTDIYNLQLQAGYEARNSLRVHCRLVPCHLAKPLDAVKEMSAIARPGGLVIAFDTDVEGLFSVPPTDAYERARDLIFAPRAGDPRRGANAGRGGGDYGSARGSRPTGKILLPAKVKTSPLPQHERTKVFCLSKLSRTIGAPRIQTSSA